MYTMTGQCVASQTKVCHSKIKVTLVHFVSFFLFVETACCELDLVTTIDGLVYVHLCSCASVWICLDNILLMVQGTTK